MQLDRVFISSVFGGMLDLRDTAARAARLVGLEPVLTEQVAQPGSVREALGREIAACDTYVGLFDRRLRPTAGASSSSTPAASSRRPQQEKGRKLLVDKVLATVPPERRPAFDRLCLLEAPLPSEELETLLAAEGIENPSGHLGWLRAPLQIEAALVRIDDPPKGVERTPGRVDDPPGEAEDPRGGVEDPRGEAEDPRGEADDPPGDVDDPPGQIEPAAGQIGCALGTEGSGPGPRRSGPGPSGPQGRTDRSSSRGYSGRRTGGTVDPGRRPAASALGFDLPARWATLPSTSPPRRPGSRPCRH
jgi:Domain of unknown function (DUF4062)